MKTKFLKIFCIYIIILTVSPCADIHDFDDCCMDNFVHFQEGRDSDVHADLCTPFCNCLCCNTLTLTSNVYSVSIYFNSSNLNFAESEFKNAQKLSPESPPPRS